MNTILCLLKLIINFKVEEAAINNDGNAAKSTGISTSESRNRSKKGIVEKRAPSNKGTLEALTGLEQTEVLFERFQVLKKSPPTTSEEYKTATKYFRNIRQRQECALPTMTECENSGVGLAFGLVWDTTDPETQWSSATSAARTTTDPMVSTNRTSRVSNTLAISDPAANSPPASNPFHRKRKRSVQVATTSLSNTYIASDLPTASDSTNATSSRALQSTRQRNPSAKKAQGFQAIKRIVNQRESNPPRHLEKEGFNSSEPLRASLRRNDVSIKLLQNRSRVYNIN